MGALTRCTRLWENVSIRAKDEGPGKIELTAKQNSLVFWISVVLTPALAALAGVGVWVRRRRL